MKSIIASLTLFVVCASASLAIDSPPMFQTGSVSLGPYAGFTYVSVSLDPSTEGVMWATGIAAGLDARYYMCESFNLQLGLRYEQRASKQLISSAFSTLSASEIRNYLMFDITSAWYFAEMWDGGFRPRMYAGVFVGSFLSGTGTSSITVGGGSPQTTERKITSDDVNALNWGPKVGIGFDLKLGPGALTFGLSYDYGMSNLTKTSTNETPTMTAYDRGLSAGLGYQIGL